LGGLDVGGARISEIMSPELIRGLVSEAAPMDPDVIGVRFSGALGFDVDSVLREVACPVRLVRGNPELGGLVLEKDARRIQANSSDFEERYDSKAGHGIHRKPFDRAFAEDIRLLTDLVS